eukprot:10348162-Heterocapsa_arctica.AAC.1
MVSPWNWDSVATASAPRHGSVRRCIPLGGFAEAGSDGGWSPAKAGVVVVVVVSPRPPPPPLPPPPTL